MSDVIQNEAFFFLTCTATGVLLVFAYDLLRIMRRVFKHGTFLTGFEDFLYWSISAFVIFCMIYEKNNGAIRGFAIAGIVLGVLLYHESVSQYIVKWISSALKFIFRGMSKIFDIISRPLRFLSKYLRKIKDKRLKFVRKSRRIESEEVNVQQKMGKY